MSIPLLRTGGDHRFFILSDRRFREEIELHAFCLNGEQTRIGSAAALTRLAVQRNLGMERFSRYSRNGRRARPQRSNDRNLSSKAPLQAALDGSALDDRQLHHQSCYLKECQTLSGTDLYQKLQTRERVLRSFYNNSAFSVDP